MSSLPSRQLRKQKNKSSLSQACSLPSRQLRNKFTPLNGTAGRLLLHRQLRKNAQTILEAIDEFTAE